MPRSERCGSTEWGESGVCGLFAGRAVDRLADQVGVTVVAGPFLDQVQVQRVDRPGLAASVEGVVQTVPCS